MANLANCLENLPTCVWFEGGERRNSISSIVAGLLFFTGWWFMIDAQSVHPSDVKTGYHVCGVIGTLSLFMVNAVSNAQVRGDSFSGGHLGPRGARAWLFVGFVLGFAAVIASCWILFADFIGGSHDVGAGIGLFIQNFFIFASSLVYKFGRTEDQWT